MKKPSVINILVFISIGILSNHLRAHAQCTPIQFYHLPDDSAGFQGDTVPIFTFTLADSVYKSSISFKTVSHYDAPWMIAPPNVFLPFPFFLDSFKIIDISGVPQNIHIGTDAEFGPTWNTTSAPYGIWTNTGPNLEFFSFGCLYFEVEQNNWPDLVSGGPSQNGLFPITITVDAYVYDVDQTTQNHPPSDMWISELPPSVAIEPFIYTIWLRMLSCPETVDINLSGPFNIFPDSVYTYSVAESSDYGIHWVINNGSIVSGQNTANVSVIWNGGSGQQITASYFNSTCSFNETINVLNQVLGLPNMTDDSFKIFPNPVSTRLVIQNDNSITSIWDRIDILDYCGRIQASYTTLSNNEVLWVDNLESGVYFLQLHAGHELISKKFIKQ